MTDIFLSQRMADVVNDLWNRFASEETDLYDFPDWVNRQVTEKPKTVLVINDGRCPHCGQMQSTGGCTNPDCIL